MILYVNIINCIDSSIFYTVNSLFKKKLMIITLNNPLLVRPPGLHTCICFTIFHFYFTPFFLMMIPPNLFHDVLLIELIKAYENEFEPHKPSNKKKVVIFPVNIYFIIIQRSCLLSIYLLLENEYFFLSYPLFTSINHIFIFFMDLPCCCCCCCYRIFWLGLSS